MQRVPPARRIALIILLVFMGAACISTSLITTGRGDLALRIFGGAFLLNLVIFVVGGWIVAANKPPDQP